MQKQLDSLLKKLKNNNPICNLDSVIKAFNYAQERHEGQLRVSGEPFFMHLLLPDFCMMLLKIQMLRMKI